MVVVLLQQHTKHLPLLQHLCPPQCGQRLLLPLPHSPLKCPCQHQHQHPGGLQACYLAFLACLADNASDL